ncbi:MAG: cytochrome c [Deltaproteobacteria bacterium]|nr:cytochrome c [Deltaproteobacteria bacterium]
MKRLIAVGVVALAVAFTGSAFAADGAATFKAKCAACHGADGQGTAMAPAFKANKFILESKEDVIAATVTNGRAGAEKKYKQFTIAMPAQGKVLSADDIKAVVAHLKTIAAAK